jgi:hypothetical protein
MATKKGTNNPNGRPLTEWGERKSTTLRLPVELMAQVEKVAENKTDFTIEAIAAHLQKSR